MRVESLKINSNVEIDQHQQKKVNAKKTASYYKVKASKLREKLKSDNTEPIKTLKYKLTEKDAKIHEDEINESKIKTCAKDGTFTDNVRFCVIN
jgi:hypothetical protein